MKPCDVQRVFDGCNLLERLDMCDVFLSLIGGSGGKKPYECIGTFQESSAAAELSLRQWEIESLIVTDNTEVKNQSNKTSSVPIALKKMVDHLGIQINEGKCTLEVHEIDEILKKWAL